MKKFLLVCMTAIIAMTANAATVTGKVVTPDKTPVAGAMVMFLGDASFFPTTDDSGVFTQADVPAGTYYMVVRADGFPEFENPSVIVGDTDLDLGEIELEVPTYRLNGRVYVALQDGNVPLPGSEVTLKYEAGGETVVLGPQITLDDGSFLFEKLPLNTSYEVTATHDMNEPQTVTVPAGVDNDYFLDIVLQMITDGPTVTGAIVNNQGEPVNDATIRFCIKQADGSLGSEYICVCENTNIFEQTNMQPNTSYKVIITAENYNEKIIDDFQLADEDVDMGNIDMGAPLHVGIESIEAGTAEAPVYYNLQGQRIANPQGICVKVEGSKASKVYVK